MEAQGQGDIYDISPEQNSEIYNERVNQAIDALSEIELLVR